jgi:hypothetical protein
MTSGDAAFTDDLAAPVLEEVGGPFIVTGASDEMGEALEERSPLDAPRAKLRSFREAEQARAPSEPSRASGRAQEGVASRAPRSWPSLSLPRVQKIAEWFGKRWSGR